MEDKLMIIPFVFVTIGLILGAILGTSFSVDEILRLEKENSELKTQNHKLEQKLLKLYEEQAEQTKRTAERNGVGG